MRETHGEEQPTEQERPGSLPRWRLPELVVGKNATAELQADAFIASCKLVNAKCKVIQNGKSVICIRRLTIWDNVGGESHGRAGEKEQAACVSCPHPICILHLLICNLQPPPPRRAYPRQQTYKKRPSHRFLLSDHRVPNKLPVGFQASFRISGGKCAT